MAQFNILIGCESFKEIRENHVYVDKTSIIEEMLTGSRSKVSLITRPRRFGKSLMMSMLHAFFDISKDNRHLFEGLAILKNTELCEKWMNKCPTVSLSLKGITGNNYSSSIRQIKYLMARVCNNYDYLLESPKVKPSEKKLLSLLINVEADDELLMVSLQVLSDALKRHWEKPVILLVDEYDVPINHAKQKGYYEDMVNFMRNFLGESLKSNDSLEFAVLTGCLRIARESIFTGLNNFSCFGISHTKYADKFGFTPQEVAETAQSSVVTPINRAFFNVEFIGISSLFFQ